MKRKAVPKARLSIDVSTEMRRRIRMIASAKELTIRDYVVQAIEEKLQQDLVAAQGLLNLSADADPVLAELWSNEKDAEYDLL